MKAADPDIYALIQPICSELGIYLQEVAIHGGGSERIIRVIADTENGITLQECKNLSDKITDIFYRKNIFEGNYRLEVSSPGVEKPLEHGYEFRRNIGRSVQTEYVKEGTLQRIEGLLAEYTDKNILIRNKMGDTCIPINDLKRVKVKLQW